jgi:hypothetical protein
MPKQKQPLGIVQVTWGAKDCICILYNPETPFKCSMGCPIPYHLQALKMLCPAGHVGGEDCIYNLVTSFNCEDVTDLGIKSVAKGCTNLRQGWGKD